MCLNSGNKSRARPSGLLVVPSALCFVTMGLFLVFLEVSGVFASCGGGMTYHLFS